MSPVSFDDRADWLVRARSRKMARSGHAYVCGNAAQFYAWLRDVE